MSIGDKVENHSKAYQIGEFSTGGLFLRIWSVGGQKSGKEDPFLKLGEGEYKKRKKRE